MEENIERIYRHGDVIIFKLINPPSSITNEKKVDTLVLALGEVTGHKHVLTGDVYEIETGEETDGKFFKVTGTATLTHEEHAKIIFEKGYYLKVDQVEYDPFKDMLRRITD